MLRTKFIFYRDILQRFSTEGRTTKPKFITLANHKLKDAENQVNQSKLVVITCR